MEHSDVVVTVHDINQYDEENRQLDERLNHLKANKLKRRPTSSIKSIFTKQKHNVKNLKEIPTTLI